MDVEAIHKPQGPPPRKTRCVTQENVPSCRITSHVFLWALTQQKQSKSTNKKMAKVVLDLLVLSFLRVLGRGVSISDR